MHLSSVVPTTPAIDGEFGSPPLPEWLTSAPTIMVFGNAPTQNWFLASPWFIPSSNKNRGGCGYLIITSIKASRTSPPWYVLVSTYPRSITPSLEKILPLFHAPWSFRTLPSHPFYESLVGFLLWLHTLSNSCGNLCRGFSCGLRTLLPSCPNFSVYKGRHLFALEESDDRVHSAISLDVWNKSIDIHPPLLMPYNIHSKAFWSFFAKIRSLF